MTPASRAEGEDVLGVIDEEIARLPARFRDAVVLCDLEGRSYAEAARRLRCPLGTLQSRLARGRARLRTRLVTRGVAPFAVSAILAESARASVPEALAEATDPGGDGRDGLRDGRRPGRPGREEFADVHAQECRGPSDPRLDRDGRRPAGPRPACGRADCPPTGASRPGTATDRSRRRTGLSIWRWSTAPIIRPWPVRRCGSGLSGVCRTSRRARPMTRGTTRSRSRPRPTPSLEGRRHPLRFRARSSSDGTGEGPIPDTYTVALERGVPIGGTVRDEQGRPIAGARVHLRIEATPPRGGRERYPDPDCEVAAALTDAQGRWRSEALPASARAGVRLELVITHPDHVGLKQSVTAEALRAFAAVGTMKAGRSLSGTVASPTGRPVAGATVVIQSRSDRKTIQRVQTDREGQFRTGPFIDPSWSEFTVVVQADGFALSAQTLLIPPEIPPQAFRLSPRKPLQGRVVDSRGRPIPGAVVRSATEFGHAGLDWGAETDADGRFVWYEAPATGSYMLNVHKRPFRPIVARMVSGGSTDLTLTMHRPQRVHGTVTDAETGRPIERFFLISGWGPIRPGWQPQWSRNSPDSFGDGKFDLPGPSIDQDTYHSIRIEAEGYEPAEFIGYHDSQEDVAHDFKLRKAARLTGIVRGPDGRPMAGVDVAISGDGYEARIKDGRLQSGSGGYYGSLQVRTRPDGRYAFPRRGRRVSVVAVHDAGFAIRSVDELAVSTDLILAPWARIEGMLQDRRLGRRPEEFWSPGSRSRDFGARRSARPAPTSRAGSSWIGSHRVESGSIAASITRTSRAGRSPTRCIGT